jgi:hypothetical protein
MNTSAQKKSMNDPYSEPEDADTDADVLTLTDPSSTHEPGTPTTPTLGLALALVALGMALLGRYLMVESGLPWLTAAAFLTGILAFLRLVAIGAEEVPPTEVPRAPEGEPQTAGRRFQAYLGEIGRCLDPRGLPTAIRQAITQRPLTAASVAMSLVLSTTVAALLHARTDATGPSYWDVVGLWLLSIGLYMAAALQPQRWLSRARLGEGLRRHRGALLDAGILLVLALALRVIGLDRAPDVIGGDEGLIGMTGRDLFNLNHGHVFGTIYGYGTAYFQAVGLSLLAFGSDTGIAALRLPAALGGALAVPATYALGRQLFGRRVGLVAGALLATAHMHVHMSRVAYGQSIDTLTAALALFALARGLERRSVGWMAVAGVWLGLAQYGYTAGRLIDLVALVFVVLLLLLDPARLRGARLGLAAALGAAVVTAMPIIRWAIDRAPDYFDRVDKAGFMQSGEMATRIAQTGRPAGLVLLVQMHDAVRAVIAVPPTSFYGARIPMLDAIWAALLALAVGYALWRIRDWRFLLLVLDLAGGLAVLTLGGLVLLAGYRVLGLLPSIAVLVAFALVMLVERALRGLLVPARLGDAVIAGVVAVVAVYNVNYYFREFVPNCAYMDPRTAAGSIAGRYLADEARAGETVLLLNAPGLDIAGHTATQFFTRRQPLQLPTTAPEVPGPGAPGAERFVYTVGPDYGDLTALVRPAASLIVMAGPEQTGQIDAVAAARPGGIRTTLSRCGKPVFLVYKVGPAQSR